MVISPMRCHLVSWYHVERYIVFLIMTMTKTISYQHWKWCLHHQHCQVVVRNNLLFHLDQQHQQRVSPRYSWDLLIWRTRTLKIKQENKTRCFSLMDSVTCHHFVVFVRSVRSQRTNKSTHASRTRTQVLL